MCYPFSLLSMTSARWHVVCCDCKISSDITYRTCQLRMLYISLPARERFILIFCNIFYQVLSSAVKQVSSLTLVRVQSVFISRFTVQKRCISRFTVYQLQFTSYKFSVDFKTSRRYSTLIGAYMFYLFTHNSVKRTQIWKFFFRFEVCFNLLAFHL